MTLSSDFALLGIVCWIGSEVLLRRREFAAAGTWQADDRDRGSTRLLIVCFVATGVINTVFNSMATAQLPTPVRWFGIAVLAGGLALRAWGMRTLSQYYTRTLRTVDGQRVVQEGPYKLIRHPGYCGSLLVWIGYSLGLGGWAATPIVAALLTAAYLRRVSTDERLLTTASGPAYADYPDRTKRLVPYVF